MPRKRYCQKCKKLIEEGQEIKYSKRIGYYSSSRYSSGPQSYVTYYLHPECYEQQQEEIGAKNKKVWKTVGLTLLVIVLVLMVAIVIFLVHQHQRDKRVDRITRKSRKKQLS